MYPIPDLSPAFYGHEPAACDAIADTSAWCDLSKAKGVLITFLHYRGGDTDWVLTVHEGTAASGTTAITTGAEFPIWVCLDALTDPTMVRQTDAVTYTVNTGDYTGSQIVQFYIDASILSAGYRYVQAGCSGGNASSIAAILYQYVGLRMKGDGCI